LRTACPNPNPRDPWEPFNREITAVQRRRRPRAAQARRHVYREKVPPLVRTGVSNFFGNLGDAWSA
jgi:phospholipid-binding lipoprotein MlaA